MSTLWRNVNIVWNWILNTQYTLQHEVARSGEIMQCPDEKESRTIITCIVFRKFLGSSGSSKGYAPTSITYRVTPQDHTSAIYKSPTNIEEEHKNSCIIMVIGEEKTVLYIQEWLHDLRWTLQFYVKTSNNNKTCKKILWSRNNTWICNWY